jgi:hypothetical protein
MPIPRGQTIARGFIGCDSPSLKNFRWTELTNRVFAPTGGTPIDDGQLRKFAFALEHLASESGYPGDTSRQARSKFDEEVLRFLADHTIPFTEAIRPETWAWIAVLLVPHLVHWRWRDASNNVSLERFAGPLIRNALGRLWYQAQALALDANEPSRWKYSDPLGADQVVGLLERPSLGAHRGTCLAVAKAWGGLPPKMRSEHLFRETMKSLIITSAVRRFEIMDGPSLDLVVADCFQATHKRLQRQN